MSTTENVHETALAICFRLIEILLHGESTFVEFPVLASVCPICQGLGKCIPDAVASLLPDAGGASEFMELYLSGYYERPCSECKGLRVIASFDMEAIEADTGLFEAYKAYMKG